MKCPGSVGLSEGVHDEESDFALEGTTAHSVASECLVSGEDAWQWIGAEFGFEDEPGIEVSKGMADAVQVYLDAVRKAHPDRNQGNFFVERSFHCPSVHELFYGTTDCAYFDARKRTLDVWDYKHGAGIVVEVERNVQCMYYAVGALEELKLWGDVDVIHLHIAQPRGFHWQGPVRSWSIRIPELAEWRHCELVPAMRRALVSRDTVSGEHCRFCPSRGRACPQILADVEEFEELAKMPAEQLTNEQVARLLSLGEVVKIALKAAKGTAFTRLSAGHAIPGWKLGKARANRIWKDGAEAALREKFGDGAFNPPELKSPAQVEEMPEGGAFVERFAFKPDAGLTVIPGSDTRPAVSKETKSMFEQATAKRKGR